LSRRRGQLAPRLATPTPNSWPLEGRTIRKGAVKQKTNETAVDLDGSGAADVGTGVGFFDHMLEQLARHCLIDMTIRAEGDRHAVEDVGGALGQALSEAHCCGDSLQNAQLGRVAR